MKSPQRSEDLKQKRDRTNRKVKEFAFQKKQLSKEQAIKNLEHTEL